MTNENTPLVQGLNIYNIFRPTALDEGTKGSIFSIFLKKSPPDSLDRIMT